MADNNKMNIIEALVKLRNDLKLWVANNLRVKLDKNLGEENANKLLSTDAEGNVTAVAITLDGDVSGESEFNGSDLTISVEEKTLKDIKGKFITKTVGGVTKGTTIESDSVEDLIRTLLGIQDGVAPASGSFSFTLSPASIAPALGTTSYSGITASWTINDGTTTYNGNYTPTIGGISGTATPLNASTKKATGTISGLAITFGDSDTSKTISGSAAYAAEDGFTAGSLTANKAITINRVCYYGKDGSTLSQVNRTSKNNWVINITLNNEKAVFQYPKVWGELTKVVDANGYDVTLGFAKSEVTQNGGLYYQYISTALNTGDFKYTIS